MSGEFFLGLDQGTTGSTALLFDSNGRVTGRAYREIRQHYPQPGWVEHDPEEIWASAVAVLKEAVSSSGVAPGAILGLGLTNQRETTILWDRSTGAPVHRAIVWQCRRTSESCRALKEAGHEPSVRTKTGLLLDPYFSATKAAWILDHVSGARHRADGGELMFGTVDTWLLYRLTGGRVHATDFTNASRTLLFDIHSRTWSPELCDLFGVPLRILPEVRPSSGDFGTMAPEILGAPVPLLGAAGDQQAALFGHFATSPGEAKCTFGTGAFAVVFTGREAVTSHHGLLTTLTCDAGGKPAYGLEGSIFMAGAIVQWLRDGLGLISRAAETEALARSVPDTGGVVLVPAFVGLGAPHWDAEARAALLGMTRGTSRAHVVRAALEAIAYQTADLADAMAADMGRPLTGLRVDGGATTNDFLMQFLADLLQTEVFRPPMAEMTAFGAARLAAVARGMWRNTLPTAEGTRRFTPSMPAELRNRLKGQWKSAVDRVRSK